MAKRKRKRKQRKKDAEEGWPRVHAMLTGRGDAWEADEEEEGYEEFELTATTKGWTPRRRA